MPELDGIRGLAILLVLIWHYLVGPAGEPASSALRLLTWAGSLTWSGVDLFFVLSGFLIGGILIDAKASENYFRTFYIRRVFRILPIYVAICFGYAILHAVARAPVEHLFGEPMPWFVYATFTQNFWLAYHRWAGFLDVAWSLAVEEQFYLTVPAVIWFTPRHHLWKLIGGLALASAVTRSILYLHYGSGWGLAAYTLMTSRADALLLGVLSALAMRSDNARAFLSRRSYLLRASALISTVVVVAIAAKRWTVYTAPMSTFGYTALAVFYAFILLTAVTSPGSLISRFFRLRWLRWLGGIAYCLYLVHRHMQQLAYAALGYSDIVLQRWPDALPMLLALAASLLVSHFSWTLFESRLVRFGHRFTYRATSRPASDAVAGPALGAASETSAS